MARLPRLVVPQQPHHVIQYGNNREQIFRDALDHQAFLKWLREGAKRFAVAIHAYVLMPDHFHLLLSPADQQGLGRLMQWMGRYYVPYFNTKYHRTGTLWQGRYRATVIESERYFMACSSYIELNPVRAGLVTEPRDYRWSSYGHHTGMQSDPVLTDHSLYWALGNTPFEREAAYRTLVEQGIAPEEVQAISEATAKGWALGGEQYIDKLEQLTLRRVRPAKKGRPLKRRDNVPLTNSKAEAQNNSHANDSVPI